MNSNLHHRRAALWWRREEWDGIRSGGGGGSGAREVRPRSGGAAGRLYARVSGAAVRWERGRTEGARDGARVEGAWADRRDEFWSWCWDEMVWEWSGVGDGRECLVLPWWWWWWWCWAG